MTMKPAQKSDILVSLPTAMTHSFADVFPERAKNMFVTSDPDGTQLGSGGGTVNLLLEGYRSSGVESFSQWLAESPKLLLHGSGESRRLQAYAVEGKPLMPIPRLPSIAGQSPQQTLLDLQLASYGRIARLAPPSYRAMVTCGDVYLSFAEVIPRFPNVDVLVVGMHASPEEAQHHGVMVCDSDSTHQLKTFLQKPSVQDLAALDNGEQYFLDTGVWLFSQRALAMLMQKCDIDPQSVVPENDAMPSNYDLFATFGPALGTKPLSTDSDISSLSCAVLPLAESTFYHFGSNRSIMASTTALLSPAEDKRSFANASLDAFGAPICIDSNVECSLTADNRHIWIDRSCISSGWLLSSNHVLTGIPDNAWEMRLAAGTCLSGVPMQGGLLLKFYGFDDTMRGSIKDGSARIFGVPLQDWFAKRGIEPADADCNPDADIYDLPLFPVLNDLAAAGQLVNWLVATEPADNPGLRQQYIECKRGSARDALKNADLKAIRKTGDSRLQEAMSRMTNDRNSWSTYCLEHDLSRLAAISNSRSISLPDTPEPVTADMPSQVVLGAIHENMLRDECGAPGKADESFSLLRGLIVHNMEIAPIKPNRSVLDDQLVWGRSPLRLDLAGGWSDTPPYCMEHGGRVVNVAVDLNGQPPVQVFGRINDRKDILLRSIDLGVSETIPSYDALLTPAALGSDFGIAKAALALAGFDPRFHVNHNYRTLQNQLDAEFGGGLELSMVCAVPKGSGLGTSSILAATIIGTLNELCGLGLDIKAISQRTLALEQLLTSGGGWQDQAGGITRGIKLMTTDPGVSQAISFNWLPPVFFEEDHTNQTVLLYYTGITRVAHDILGEIVRNMFLNSAEHLSILSDISSNALYAAEACQRNDWNQICEAIRRSWQLNQLLDPGTNPESVQGILDCVGDHLSACKLLGAGGGGYMLMLAKDQDAAEHIRHELESNPPNATARFVNLAISKTGLQVTKS